MIIGAVSASFIGKYHGCEVSSGLVSFAFIHGGLRLIDATQCLCTLLLIPAKRLPSLQLLINCWCMMRFWFYLVNYLWARIALGHCQQCMYPQKFSISNVKEDLVSRLMRWWWIASPKYASPLGVLAHALLWIDTVVWTACFVIGRIPSVKRALQEDQEAAASLAILEKQEPNKQASNKTTPVKIHKQQNKTVK